MLFNSNSLLLYAVTDRSYTVKKTLYEQLEDALIGGATCVQLREKNLDEDSFIKEAVRIRELCNRYGVPFLIDDNLSVAIKSKADGIHVGQSDMPVDEIRKMVGENFIIGATVENIEQAKKAEKDGANYLGVGAIFPTLSKKDAIYISKEQLKEICSSVSIPTVAIGGIKPYNIHEISNCGISGIAVIEAIFGADDIKDATQELKKIITQELKRNNLGFQRKNNRDDFER